MLTNAGRDHVLACVYGTGAQPAAANYMALSADDTAPSASSTVLDGEITTEGGGLVRAQATYAHTGGQSTATLTKTFTANSSDSLPVVIAKIGIFNASTSGTLTNETLLDATASLAAEGDQVTITDTITVSGS